MELSTVAPFLKITKFGACGHFWNFQNMSKGLWPFGKMTKKQIYQETTSWCRFLPSLLCSLLSLTFIFFGQMTHLAEKHWASVTYHTVIYLLRRLLESNQSADILKKNLMLEATELITLLFFKWKTIKIIKTRWSGALRLKNTKESVAYKAAAWNLKVLQGPRTKDTSSLVKVSRAFTFKEFFKIWKRTL